MPRHSPPPPRRGCLRPVLALLLVAALALIAWWMRGDGSGAVTVPSGTRAAEAAAPRTHFAAPSTGPTLTAAALRARLDLRTRSDAALAPPQACLLAEALWACKSLEDLTLTLAAMADRGQVDPNSPAFAGLIDPEQHAACETVSPADHARAYALQRMAALQGGARLKQSFVMSPWLGRDERQVGRPRYDDYRALATRWLDAWWQAPRREVLLALLGDAAPEDVQVFRPAVTRPDPVRFVALVRAAEARGVGLPGDVTRFVPAFERTFTPDQRRAADGMTSGLMARWRDPPGAAEPFRFDRDACAEDAAR